MAIALKEIRKTIYLVRHTRQGGCLLTANPVAGYEILASWKMRGEIFDTTEVWTVTRIFGGDHTVDKLETRFREHLYNPSDALAVDAVEYLSDAESDMDYQRTQKQIRFTVEN